MKATTNSMLRLHRVIDGVSYAVEVTVESRNMIRWRETANGKVIASGRITCPDQIGDQGDDAVVRFINTRIKTGWAWTGKSET